LETDVSSLTLADRHQWFEYFARHQTVSILNYYQRQYNPDAAVADEISIEPANVPAEWRQLLEELRVRILEWSWTQHEATLLAAWGVIKVEWVVQRFLGDHSNELESPSSLNPIDKKQECLATPNATSEKAEMLPARPTAKPMSIMEVTKATKPTNRDLELGEHVEEQFEKDALRKFKCAELFKRCKPFLHSWGFDQNYNAFRHRIDRLKKNLPKDRI
jgi:hypothetical protein